MLRDIRKIEDDEQDDEKNKIDFHWISSEVNQTSLSGGVFCPGDQCAVSALPSLPETTVMQPTMFASLTVGHNDYLPSILPPGYYEAMKKAAQHGFLYSFLSSMPAELFEHYFKQKGFSAN